MTAENEEGYRISADRQIKRMKEGIPLGTKVNFLLIPTFWFTHTIQVQAKNGGLP
jgi:hypothetical protein